MEHHTPLAEILILIVAAVGVVALFRSFRLSPVLGYLVAGALIGPHGIGWIHDVSTTQGIAELGVVFLLFMIGMELSWARLKAMRTMVFGFGTAQVFFTSAVIGGVMLLFGMDLTAVVIVGGGLALSSTALVLQVIEETGEKGSQVGRLALSILLLQDLAVMPLLVLMPLLAAGEIGNIGFALIEASIRAAVAMVLIFSLGRLILRPIFRFIASLQNEELFAATTLLIVLGTSWLTETAGLSMALGAFMAGLLVAETEFHHQVEADVKPYKGLLLGLFFMTVGMAVDLSLLIEMWHLILLASLVLILTKFLIIHALLRMFKFGSCASVHTALLLAQGGEFGFILFTLAGEMEIFSQHLTQVLLVIVSVTMALTPLLSLLGQRLAARIRSTPEVGPDSVKQETLDLEDHVIVAGYGRMGKMVTEILQTEEIPFIALEFNPAEVTDGRQHNAPVYYGDATRMEVLEAVGIKRARAAIVTFKNERMATQVVKALRKDYPYLPIIVRVNDLRQAKDIKEIGANVAVPEIFEGSLQIAGALLRELGVPEHEIQRVTTVFRKEDYSLKPDEEGAA